MLFGLAFSISGCKKGPANSDDTQRSGETIEFKRGLPAGEYEMLVETNDDSEMEGMKGETIDIRYYDLIVEPAKEDGTQEITMLWNRIRFKSTAGNYVSADFDSATQKPQKRREINKAQLLGLKLKQTIDKNGKLIKTEGIEEFIDGLITQDPSKKEMLTAVKAMTRGGNYVTYFTQFWQILPDEPVAVGETWKKKSVLDNQTLGSVPLDIAAKIEKIEEIDGEKLAQITGTGILKTNEETEIQSGPMKLKYKSIDFDSKISMKIEPNTGLVHEYNMDFETEQTMLMRTSSLTTNGKGNLKISIKRKNQKT